MPLVVHVVEQRVHERAAGMSRRRVDDHPGRLVDDDHVGVLIQDASGSASAPRVASTGCGDVDRERLARLDRACSARAPRRRQRRGRP